MTTIPPCDATEAKTFFEHKLAFTTGPVEVSKQIKASENITIIDVREAEDFQKGHVPGAINLPHDKWESASGLREDSINIVYCYTQTCHLAAKAAAQFAAQGYRVMEMEGGFEAWTENDLPVEK